MSSYSQGGEQARAHGVLSVVPFMVTPGSDQIRATIERTGQLARFGGHRRFSPRQRVWTLHRAMATGQ